MTIKIHDTEFNTGTDTDEGADAEGVNFRIELQGKASDRKEVMALLAQVCELAEEGVISTELHEQAQAPAVVKDVAAVIQGGQPANDSPVREKRRYTRRLPVPETPTNGAAKQPEFPAITKADITAAHEAIHTIARSQAPVPATEAITRTREADVPAQDPDALTSEELAAYERANPFTEPVAVKPTPSVSAAPPAINAPSLSPPPATAAPVLSAAIRDAKNIRDLLSAMAHELGERMDLETGAITNEPSAEMMLAYAEKVQDALAKECVLFKGGFNFGRVKTGIDSIYESRPAT